MLQKQSRIIVAGRDLFFEPVLTITLQNRFLLHFYHTDLEMNTAFLLYDQYLIILISAEINADLPH